MPANLPSERTNVAACALAASLLCLPGASFGASAEGADADISDANHLLVGSWTWTRKANNCTEVYEYHVDGTSHIVSGEEQSDNSYHLSATPSPEGFYALTSTMVKDYGGKDCADSSRDDTGTTFTVYVLFSPSGDEHLVCFEQSMSRCFGPLRRVKK